MESYPSRIPLVRFSRSVQEIPLRVRHLDSFPCYILTGNFLSSSSCIRDIMSPLYLMCYTFDAVNDLRLLRRPLYRVVTTSD